jgi:hypothetical protein
MSPCHKGKLEPAQDRNEKGKGIEKKFVQHLRECNEKACEHDQEHYQEAIGNDKISPDAPFMTLAEEYSRDEPGQKDRYDQADLHIEETQEDLEAEDGQDLTAHIHEPAREQDEFLLPQPGEVNGKETGQGYKENKRI